MHLRHPFLGDQIEAALSRSELGQHLHADDAKPGVKHGWQFQATLKVEDCYLRDHVARY